MDFRTCNNFFAAGIFFFHGGETPPIWRCGMQYEQGTKELIMAAGRIARQMGNSYVGSQHLLLGLCATPCRAGQLLLVSGFDPDLAQSMAAMFYGKGTPGLPLPQGLSPEARRILHGAGVEARRQNARRVGSIHVLLSVLRQRKTAAKELLLLSGIIYSRMCLVN